MDRKISSNSELETKYLDALKENNLLKERLNQLENIQSKDINTYLNKVVTSISHALDETVTSNVGVNLNTNRLIHLLMNAPAMICVLHGPKHMYQLVNHLYKNLIGNRDVIGKPIRDTLPEQENQKFYELLDSVYQTGNTYTGNEVPGTIDRNGEGILEEGFFNFVFQPIINNSDEIEGVSIFAFDVTEQVLSRQKIEDSDRLLKKQTEELQRSNKELEHFAYIASHDLQEPLRMIMSYSKLIEKRYTGKLDSDADEFLHFISDGAKRMQNLINELLKYSKIRAIELTVQLTNLNAVLKDVIKTLEITIQDNNVTINYNNLPIVNANPTQINQLLQNLITNAIKFHDDKRPPVIDITATEGEFNWVISVADNGIGMEAENLSRIFEIFQRLHTNKEYKGSGMGLAICKKIVERHNGNIWVESEKGKGSTFYFTLPKI